MEIHATSELKADKLESQVKAKLDPLETLRKARQPNRKATPTPAIGIPCLVVFKKTLGAAPCRARAVKVRDTAKATSKRAQQKIATRLLLDTHCFRCRLTKPRS